MDFTRVELLNPNTLTFTRKSVVDANDPVFDADNDLLFSRNGVIISFPKPLEGYRWIEIEMENVGNPVINLAIDCYSNSSGSLSQKATALVAALNSYANYKIKIPNIGRCERIEIQAATHATANYVAIKSLRVVLDTPDFSKVISSAVVPTMTGWTFDAVNGWYYKDFAAGESGVWAVNAAFVYPTDFVNVKIWNLTDDSIAWNFANIEGKSISMTGHTFEMDFIGDSLIQAFPLNLNIFGAGPGGRVYASIKYGSFPQKTPSAFTSLATAIPGPVAVAANILGANNDWTGTNNFLGGISFNCPVNLGLGVISWGVPAGFVKVVAGTLTTVASVAVGSISGAGNILTHNVAEFFQVANNLSEGTPATMRLSLGLGNAALSDVNDFLARLNNLGDLANVATARTNLGLGTIALQNANAVAITGGNIDGTPVGVTTLSTARLSTLALSNTLVAGSLLSLGNISVHPSAATSIYGSITQLIAPSTATTALYGNMSRLDTAAAAFSCASIYHYYAFSTVRGAGSTITSVYGFAALNGIAFGTNNYGFYSSINNAATTYQCYMAGTAPSYFGGATGIGNGALTTDPIGQGVLLGVGHLGHPSTGNTVVGIFCNYTALSSATAGQTGIQVRLSSANAAYTINIINGIAVDVVTKQGASVINQVRGFYAANTIAVGTNNYGFYSDINVAATTFQLSMQGTAKSRFGGPVYFAQDNSTTQAISALFQGTGVPNNANGNDGDFYLRGDTPGTANQRLYVKAAGAWAGIL